MPVPFMRHGGRWAGAVVAVWLVVLIVATVLLSTFPMPGGSGGSAYGVRRGVFLAASAATLTGFETSFLGGRQAPPGARTTLAAAHATGAGACWVIATLALLRHFARQGIDARRAAFVGTVLLAAAATISAWLGLTGGLTNGYPDGRSLSATRPALWVWLWPTSVLGTMGPVLGGLVVTGRLPRHVRVAAGASAGVGLGLVVILWACGATLTQAVAVATDARSTGLLGTPDVPRAATWAVAAGCLVGATAGGTGGGIKAATLFVLAAGVTGILRHGRPAGRTSAFAWLLVAATAGLFLTTLTLLTATQPQLPGDRLVLLAASAVGNVGLSSDPVTVAGNEAWVLAAAMLAGRALPLALLWWCCTSGDDDVAVG